MGIDSNNLYEKLKRFQRNTKSEASADQEPTASVSKKPLPDALRHIPGVVPASQLRGEKQRLIELRDAFLASIGVRILSEGEGGTYGLRSRFYSAQEIPPSWPEITGAELALQSRDPQFASLYLQDILFIDTETTGLAGGTGTVPFLIGVGCFADGGFWVHQFLMRDYNEETAVLDAFERMAQRFRAMATYNGKSFDLPLLETRFALNRKRTRLSGLPHLDLLYMARRLWKRLLPDCSLSTVESGILGRMRALDVPGEQIPYIYFDFLRGIRIQRMEAVLAHNAEDLLSLALLIDKTCRMARDPLSECGHGWELFAMARCFVETEAWEPACFCLEEALARRSLAGDHRLSVYKALSWLYKRMGRLEKSEALWLQMMEEASDPYPYIELAKYYEHAKRMYSEALRRTEAALEILNHPEYFGEGGRGSRAMLLQELRHRKKRLLGKLRKKD